MSELSKRVLSSFILLFFIFLSLSKPFFLFIFLCLLAFFSLKEFKNIFKKVFKKNNLKLFVTLLLVLIYLTYFFLTIWFFVIPYSTEKILSLIFILLICSLTDIGGYIFGKTLGGKKISKISPNKTYSGAVGSLILPLILCYPLFIKLYYYFDFKINVIVLIILVSIISQLGDLVISFFKRKANIKDTGSIIPGHGGLLDRIDGILLGLPLGIVLIST